MHSALTFTPTSSLLPVSQTLIPLTGYYRPAFPVVPPWVQQASPCQGGPDPITIPVNASRQFWFCHLQAASYCRMLGSSGVAIQ